MGERLNVITQIGDLDDIMTSRNGAERVNAVCVGRGLIGRRKHTIFGRQPNLGAGGDVIGPAVDNANDKCAVSGSIN
jgi:hypothetical protein